MPTHRYGHCFYGVDYSVPPQELSQSALADAQNIVVNNSGLPQPRGGSVKYNSTTLGSRITSFFEHRSGASTRNQLISYGTKIASYNSGTGEFVDRNTGLTSGKMFQWVNFAGKAIGVNEGSNNPQYFTDTSTYGDLDGSPPKGLTIAEWANRVWFGGDSTNVALLTGTHLNDPTSVTTSGATDGVSQTVGDSKDPITGLFPFFDIMLIGKRNNIYKIYGDPPTDATELSIKPLYSKQSDNVGFTSQWAITQVGNDIIFLDGYDIKSLRGIQEYGDVEYTSIIPHFRDYLKATVDRDYLKYTQFFHYKKQQQIWVTIPTAATTHFVFCLDYKFKQDTNRFAFYPMADLDMVCINGVEDGEVDEMYFGDESGFVYHGDSGANDDGAAIDSHFTIMVSGNDSSQGILDKHEMRKQFQYSDTYIQPSTASLVMTPYYALDLLDSAQARTSSNYTALSDETVTDWSGTGTTHKRIRFFGLSGNTLALKWRQNTVGQDYIFQPSMINFAWKSKTTIE
jgi:hypothetical protein